MANRRNRNRNSNPNQNQAQTQNGQAYKEEPSYTISSEPTGKELRLINSTQISYPMEGPPLVERCLHCDPDIPVPKPAVFQTRAMVNGRVCDVRVGNAACSNFVSPLVIRKQNLVTTPHPKPYFVVTGGGGKTKITSQCRVPFVIGNYKTEILCDVMDDLGLGHIFLGYPWLHENRVTLYMRPNMYVFMHNGVKIVLASMEFVPKSNPTFVCGYFGREEI